MAERVYALIGGAIRRRRDGIGMSQETLGSRVGLSRASVTNIEAGRQPVSLHHLYNIAGAIGAKVTELMPDASLVAVRAPEEHSGEDISDLLGKLGRRVGRRAK